MAKSRLLLEHCVPSVLEIHGKNNPCDPTLGEAEPTIEFDYELLKNPDEWSYFLQIKLTCVWEESSDSFYEHISAVWNGFFRMPEDTTEEEIVNYFPVVAISNILGIMRGQIAQATGTFIGGAYYLPLFNINTLLAEKHARDNMPSIEHEIEKVESPEEDNHAPDLAQGE